MTHPGPKYLDSPASVYVITQIEPDTKQLKVTGVYDNYNLAHKNVLPTQQIHGPFQVATTPKPTYITHNSYANSYANSCYHCELPDHGAEWTDMG